MSASEIIEQIKTLPSAEQRKVATFVNTLGATAEEDGNGLRRVDRATFEKAMDSVFRKHDEVLRRLAQ